MRSNRLAPWWFQTLFGGKRARSRVLECAFVLPNEDGAAPSPNLLSLSITPERFEKMAHLTIRGAVPEDANQLLELIEIASGGFVASLFAKTVPTGMSVDDYIIARMGIPDTGLSYAKLWVCEIGGSIAGFIALDQTPAEVEPIDPEMPAMFRPLTELENQAPGCCLINLLATFPEFRGQKAGLALMEFAEARRGKNGLCLTVGDTNVAAQEFYRHLGYHITARRPVVREDWDAPYSEWLLMVKA